MIGWVRNVLLRLGLLVDQRSQSKHDRLIARADRMLAKYQDADLRIVVVRKP